MLLSVGHVSKLFGAETVLSDVTFRLECRERVALVGRNGAGKTTLLRLITGEYEPDGGSIVLQRGAKMSYLRQHAEPDEGRTVLQEAQAGIERKLALTHRLRDLEALMESGSASAEDLDEYALVHEHFLESEGYAAESDVRVVLKRLGFEEPEFDKPVAALSGGERTRLALARMLVEEPDLLILDEPTNHLDLQATEWLENWLQSFHGAVLLVSHDRAFLEATAERVLELRDGTVKAYPGPFEKYRKLRAEEEARLTEVARRQQRDIEKLDEYVRRFMNSQRTAQARGRLKMMNRLMASRVEASRDDKGIKAGFGQAARSGDIALSTERLAVGFRSAEGETTTLYKGLDWTVRYGERWGVIGENGAGKSTLLKVITGELEALDGRAKLGANVSVGVFSQDASDLDPEMSPLDVMVWELDMQPPAARDLLGRFLISGDDVFRPISTLSGGERNKLSLAKLTQLQPNLLLLDEPTNHLDMASREALAEVLKEYTGTLILVSHDRWLLSQVTDRLLDVRRAGPIQFPGGYLDYRARDGNKLASNAQQRPTVQPKAAEPTLSPRELSKEIGRMTKLVEQLEYEVAELESSLKALEDRLANVEPDADVLALSQEYQELKEQIEGTYAAWEEQSAKLETLRSMQGG